MKIIIFAKVNISTHIDKVVTFCDLAYTKSKNFRGQFSFCASRCFSLMESLCLFVYKWKKILGGRGLWSTMSIDFFLTGVAVLCQQKAGEGNWFLLCGVREERG